MKMLLTKRFSFEMAHALPDYDGKCANIHGHSYHLGVTVEGTPLADPSSPKNGMVIDFGNLRQLVESLLVEPFDHALVLPRVGDRAPDFAPYRTKLILVDFQPTTENLLLHFAALLQPALPAGTRLHSLRLAETDTSEVELLL